MRMTVFMNLISLPKFVFNFDFQSFLFDVLQSDHIEIKRAEKKLNQEQYEWFLVLENLIKIHSYVRYNRTYDNIFFKFQNDVRELFRSIVCIHKSRYRITDESAPVKFKDIVLYLKDISDIPTSFIDPDYFSSYKAFSVVAPDEIFYVNDYDYPYEVLKDRNDVYNFVVNVNGYWRT